MRTFKKILIVEDNPADLQLTKLAFNDVGVGNELVHITDGQLLIDYLKIAGNSRIAFVLLDLNMPGVDGFSVLNYIKENPSFQEIPVIVFTTSTRMEDRNRCQRLEADGFFIKPLDINEYFGTIREITNSWLAPTEFFSVN